MIGFPAACPKPHIEASPIVWTSSLRRSSSQLPFSISLTAFSVPTLHGVHCPQLSSLKNFNKFKATFLTSSLSEKTTMALNQ